MPVISIANFLVLADSLAEQARTINDAFTNGAIAAGEPVSGTGMGAGPANNNATILAANDIDVAAALAGAFQPGVSLGSILANIYGARLRALNNHVGGIGNFLAANNARVSQQFSALLWNVPSLQIFPPLVDPVATFTVTGSGAGTFTHIAAINTAQFGPAALQVVTTDVIGANAIAATLTLTTAAGGSVTKTVNIPNGSASGTVFAVDGGTIDYVDCTAISITGGTSGDAFKVRTILERNIAL